MNTNAIEVIEFDRDKFEKLKKYMADVLVMSEENALETLKNVDKSNIVLDDIRKHNTQLIEKLKYCDNPNEKMYLMIQNMNYVNEKLILLPNILMQVTMSQSSQDLCGQKLQKAHKLVEALEAYLIENQVVLPQSGTAPKVEVSKQDDVDDLLSGLGL